MSVAALSDKNARAELETLDPSEELIQILFSK